MFVIVRYRQIENYLTRKLITIREYVSDPNSNGTGQSYALELSLARVFSSKEAATTYGVCGNESIESLKNCFQSRFI